MNKWETSNGSTSEVGYLLRETPVTVLEVCERFKVCRRTVENWFASGLEAYKLGGRVYTTVEALQRFAATVVPTKPPARQRRRSRSEAEIDFEKWLGIEQK